MLQYYYYQLLDYLLKEFKLKESNPELVSHLIGLVATDYVKQLIEKNETPSEEKTADFLESTSFPASWRFSWWKKIAVKNFFIRSVQRCYDNCKRDLRYIETAFIDGLWEVLLGSRQESFRVSVGSFMSESDDFILKSVGITDSDVRRRIPPCSASLFSLASP